jgi:hypothetical protein
LEIFVFFSIDPKKKKNERRFFFKGKTQKKQNTASTSAVATFVLLAKFRQEHKFKILH